MGATPLLSCHYSVSELKTAQENIYPKVLRTLLESEKDDLTVCTRGVFSHGLIRRQNRHKGGFTCPATGLMVLSESHTFLETWE